MGDWNDIVDIINTTENTVENILRLEEEKNTKVHAFNLPVSFSYPHHSSTPNLFHLLNITPSYHSPFLLSSFPFYSPPIFLFHNLG
jgi:hypothetical protein